MTQPLITTEQIEELSEVILSEIRTNVILDDISDVVTGSPIPPGYIIEFGGSPERWRAVAGLGDTTVSSATIGDFLYFAGSPGGGWTNTSTLQLLSNRIVITGISGENFGSPIGSPSFGGSPQVVIPGSPANVTSLEIRSTVPGLMLYDTDAGSNEKAWRLILDDGNLIGELRSDNGKTANRWLELTRSGTSVSDLLLYVGQEEKAIHAIAGAAVEFYHNNINVAETTTGVAGGLRILNLATGGPDFERVLTTSDIGGGGGGGGGGSPLRDITGGDGIDVTVGPSGSPKLIIAVDATVFRTTNNLTDIADVVAGSPTIGAILYNDGTNWLKLARGTNKQVLQLGSPLLPTWQTISATDITGSPLALPNIIGGTGISVTTGSPQFTITNTDPNVDQNLWLNIASDVGGPVAANITTDTLTIAGGNKIRTNISGDTVTINVTGSPVGATNVVGGDGITITTGSPEVTVAVDGTVVRLTTGSPLGSPGLVNIGTIIVDAVDFGTRSTQTTFETTTTGSPISQTQIASYSILKYRSAEFLIEAVQGNNFHVTKLLTTHDGTNAFLTEYGTVSAPDFFGSPSIGSPGISGEQATYTVDVNGGNVRLLATPVTSSSTLFTTTATIIKIR